MQVTDDIDSLRDMIRLGTIDSVDGAHAVVRLGDTLSPPLPWITLAGAWCLWLRPTVGAQVVVISPEGDIEGGLIINGLYSTAHTATDEGNTAALTCPDGAQFSYDPAASTLLFNLAAGIANIIASGGLNFTGPVAINGPLSVSEGVTVTGEITATEDVKVGVISLKNHKHGGVSSGAAKTLIPE